MAKLPHDGIRFYVAARELVERDELTSNLSLFPMSLGVPASDSSDEATTIKTLRRSLSSIFTYPWKKSQPLDLPSPSSSTSVVHDPLALGDRTCASRVVGTSTDMRCVCIFLLYFFGFEELSLSINRHPSVPSVVNAAVPPPLTVPIRILSLPSIPKSPPPVPGELADIDNASAEELRQALKIRNEQYKELVRFVVRMSEIHTAAANRFRITPAETQEVP